MYIVLYTFNVKPNREKDFLKGWKGLTELIQKHEGSLGSRLHIKKPLNYIAYAQWPSKTHFNASGNNLPNEANTYRDLMRSSCENIKVLEKLEVVKDLLVK
ncbi:antibiotic biosynthesis monooxygenase [Winogradskyella sp.]|jgi:quinol monooxygenase YgiN|uniref:antibiotic biosynthesis monooxygenase family protein n=1 Tax=Winogradskyella sp. TaxID=1883156 RepID=UPI0025E15B10|nr:antibiotic biosynthesis monooxygenase [Winogradskyella sp.]MCT4630164.1 antibiotic biosynthesis monooxygenase [Winogradskyella sp.]